MRVFHVDDLEGLKAHVLALVTDENAATHLNAPRGRKVICHACTRGQTTSGSIRPNSFRNHAQPGTPLEFTGLSGSSLPSA